jgi:hypothetical protein
LPAHKHFGQGILRDRQFQPLKLLEPQEPSRNPRLLALDEGGVELRLRKRAVDMDRLETLDNDELCQCRITPNVPLRKNVEPFGVNLPQDIAEVKVGIGELGHVTAADIAQVSLLADGHVPGTSTSNGGMDSNDQPSRSFMV